MLREEISKNITVINDIFHGMRLGTYPQNIIDSLGTSDNLYNVIYDRKFLGDHFQGNKLKGIYPRWSSGWFINTKFQNIIMARQISRLKNRSPSAIVHFTSQQVVPFDCKNPTVTVHDLIPIQYPEETKPAVLRLTMRNLKFYKKLSYITTVSHHSKNVMMENGFQGEIEVIHNAVSREFKPLNSGKADLRKALNLPIDKKLILSISANYPRKNLSTVKETVESLGNGYALVRIGSKVGNSITLRDLDAATLNRVYNACDVLLFPSLSEGFGYPIAEAFASALPVVASDIDVFREISGNAAKLVDPTSENLAKAILEVLNFDEEYKKRGLEVAKRYTFPVFEKKIGKFYEKLLKNTGGK